MGREEKIKDGQRFGMLTVIKSESRNYIIYCYCECDCGKKKWIKAQNIYGKQQQQSCGCKKHLFKSEDITERRYNMLTAKKILGKEKEKGKCGYANVTVERKWNLRKYNFICIK